MIGDTHFAMPAAVALTSLKKSKNVDSRYKIHFIDAGLTSSDKDRIMQLHEANFEIFFIQPAVDIRHLHVPGDRSIASANSSALFKFLLPDILSTLDRVLYLDSDMIFREDLSWLSNADFEGNLAMAVADSGQLYYRHRVVEQVENYFNSGFMLLNLAAFRTNSISEKLIDIKVRHCSGNLVDQDAFNLTLQKQVKYLSVRYNCQAVNLARSARHVSI